MAKPAQVLAGPAGAIPSLMSLAQEVAWE